MMENRKRKSGIC